MIVSRKTAESFLGKKLKSLGDLDPFKEGKASYYVLSADGAKNLGGPYTKPKAKQRLKQVEYFKRNPDLGPAETAAIGAATGGVIAGIAIPGTAPIGAAAGGYIGAKIGKRSTIWQAMDAKRKSIEDYNAGVITKRQMQAIHREANAILQQHHQRRSGLRKPQPNPKPFHDREHNWNEVLIDKGGKKLTRRQILNYYKKNARNIWTYLEGQTVLVIIAPRKNEFILRRKRPSDERHIKLTKFKGIDNENSFEYWIHRRAIEFHPVLTGKMTPILWLDLDMHTTKGKAARARLFGKMKKAGPRIKRVFRKFGVNRIYAYESGQDGGLHFEGDLKKRQNVDRLRKKFTAELAKAFEDDPVFTTGLTKSGQIRLDTTTFHTLGSLRAPYSMTVTGHAKRRISV